MMSKIIENLNIYTGILTVIILLTIAILLIIGIALWHKKARKQTDALQDINAHLKGKENPDGAKDGPEEPVDSDELAESGEPDEPIKPMLSQLIGIETQEALTSDEKNVGKSGRIYTREELEQQIK